MHEKAVHPPVRQEVMDLPFGRGYRLVRRPDFERTCFGCHTPFQPRNYQDSLCRRCQRPRRYHRAYRHAYDGGETVIATYLYRWDGSENMHAELPIPLAVFRELEEMGESPLSERCRHEWGGCGHYYSRGLWMGPQIGDWRIVRITYHMNV